MPDTAITTPTRSRRRLTRLAWLLVALALGWWWVVTRPKPLRLAACVPLETTTASVELQSVADGVLVLDKPADSAASARLSAARYDWQGNRRWRIALPDAALTGWTIPPSTPCRAVAASPDGRIVASICPVKPGQLLLASWRDGAELGRVALAAGDFHTVTNWPFLSLQAMDDGRVLVYQSFARVSPLVLAQGNRLLARGEHAITAPSATEQYARVFSPDGGTLVAASFDAANLPTPFEYDTLAVDGVRLTVAVNYPGVFPSGPYQVLDGGLFITPDGVIYDSHGEAYRHGAWDTEVGAHPARARVVSQRKENQMQVFNPVTHNAWAIAPGDWITALSADGRYALATHRGASGLQSLLAGRQRPPGVPYTLRLFERPGWLRATLPLGMAADNSLTVMAQGAPYRVMDYAVAEQARRVAVLGISPQHAKPSLLLYAW